MLNYYCWVTSIKAFYKYEHLYDSMPHLNASNPII